jgi:hypothetical protein
MRRDRKKLLDEIGFAWKDDGDHNFDQYFDKLWHQYYKKIGEFKRKNGKCMVQKSYEQDASLTIWDFIGEIITITNFDLTERYFIWSPCRKRTNGRCWDKPKRQGYR